MLILVSYFSDIIDVNIFSYQYFIIYITSYRWCFCLVLNIICIIDAHCLSHPWSNQWPFCRLTSALSMLSILINPRTFDFFCFCPSSESLMSIYYGHPHYNWCKLIQLPLIVIYFIFITILGIFFFLFLSLFLGVVKEIFYAKCNWIYNDLVGLF